jgi:hypothetical protein
MELNENIVYQKIEHFLNINKIISVNIIILFYYQTVPLNQIFLLTVS